MQEKYSLEEVLNAHRKLEMLLNSEDDQIISNISKQEILDKLKEYYELNKGIMLVFAKRGLMLDDTKLVDNIKELEMCRFLINYLEKDLEKSNKQKSLNKAN